MPACVSGERTGMGVKLEEKRGEADGTGLAAGHWRGGRRLGVQLSQSLGCLGTCPDVAMGFARSILPG